MEFKDRLKELRAKSGWSQQNVAELLGVNRNTYGAWEEGRGNPSIDRLPGIAAIYGLTVDQLINGTRKRRNRVIEAYHNLGARERKIVNFIMGL